MPSVHRQNQSHPLRHASSTFRRASHRFLAMVLLLAVTTLQARPQSVSSSSGPRLVDVIITSKDPAAVQSLRAVDFQLLDGHTILPISTFASASSGTARPLSLWFVVQCPEVRTVSSGSGFMLGKTDTLTPAVRKLHEKDTVGVAHWCDDGRFAVDLAPTTDRLAPAATLQSVLSAPAVQTGTQSGQDSLRGAILQTQEVSMSSDADAIPVLIFLYGDVSGMYEDELNDTLEHVLQTSGIIYELDNGAISVQKKFELGRRARSHVVHYLSEKTGGRALSSWNSDYGKELDRIIGELYARYQLGFLPPAQDGRQHELQIKFSEEARKRLKSADLRYPSAYMASPNALRSVPASQMESDPALLDALKSSSRYSEIVFDASGRIAAAGQPAQFQLYIDPRSLPWRAMKGGDRAASLTIAVAGVSAQGQILGRTGKDFEAQQTKADLSKSSPGAVIVTLDFALPEESDHVRFIVRASGHLGSFEMPASEIRKPR
jgi:hypothetical protein